MSEYKYRRLLLAACDAAMEAIQIFSEQNSGQERGPEAARLRRDAKRAILALTKFVNND